MRRTDVILSYTDTAAAVTTSHNLGATKVARCPWVVEVDDKAPPFASRSGLAFLGNFQHPPNRHIYWTEQYLLYADLLNTPAATVLFGSAYNWRFRSVELTRFMRGRRPAGGGSFWFGNAGTGNRGIAP